jgi:hypothetical protein
MTLGAIHTDLNIIVSNINFAKLTFIFSFFYKKIHRTKFTAEPRLLLGIARIHDALNLNAIVHYKNVLALDASNVESIACLGAHFFYSDQV